MARTSNLKNEIKKQAAMIFNKYGFGFIGINELSRRIDVQKSTILYHFNTLDELIVEYLKDERVKYIDVIKRVGRSGYGLPAQFEALREIVYKAGQNKRGIAHLNVPIEYSGKSQAVFDEAREMTEDLWFWFFALAGDYSFGENVHDRKNLNLEQRDVEALIELFKEQDAEFDEFAIWNLVSKLLILLQGAHLQLIISGDMSKFEEMLTELEEQAESGNWYIYG